MIAGYILRRLAFLPLTLLLVAFATFIVLVMLIALRPIEIRFFRGRKNRRRTDPVDMDPVDG